MKTNKTSKKVEKKNEKTSNSAGTKNSVKTTDKELTISPDNPFK